MTLNRIEYPGSDETPPLLIAHGLFGSARNWGAISKGLSEDRRVVSVDMRNHGASPWFDTNSYRDMADDLAGEIDGQWDVLGHSMGGKAAMVLALTRPQRVRRLVVADIAPVAYSHSQLPMIDAMEAVDPAAFATRSQADAALAVHVDERSVRAFLLQSLDLAKGQWRLNLKVLRAEMPEIMGFPDISGSFEGPALFLTGADSSYVKAEHRAGIKAMFPKARFAKIPKAGHWLHAERPKAFTETLRAFLDA